MSKAFKKIAVFSLWLAGLVIIAHLVIPHDHHSDSFVSDRGGSCHANKTEHTPNSTGFPFHCHALNDLTFEKSNNAMSVNNDNPTCVLFIVSFYDLIISETALPGIKIKNFQKPIIKCDSLRLSPFRAPPSFV